MKFNEETINSLYKELNLEEEIYINQIPDIDLYMDQVIQLFETNLSGSKRYDSDKILTKTMINNYAKDKLLFPIKNKKYSKEHILLIILTYNMKQILSIGDIKKIFTPMIEKLSSDSDSFNLQEFYSKYLFSKAKQLEEDKEHLNSLIHEISNLHNQDTCSSNTDEEYTQVLSLVLSLLNSANQNKRLAEKIIDTYF